MNDLLHPPVGPPLSPSWSILAFASAEKATHRKETAACRFPYAQALLSSLKFPERQKAEKALMITPVRESEAREVQQSAQDHTANHAQTGGESWVS